MEPAEQVLFRLLRFLVVELVLLSELELVDQVLVRFLRSLVVEAALQRHMESAGQVLLSELELAELTAVAALHTPQRPIRPQLELPIYRQRQELVAGVR